MLLFLEGFQHFLHHIGPTRTSHEKISFLIIISIGLQSNDNAIIGFCCQIEQKIGMVFFVEGGLKVVSFEVYKIYVGFDRLNSFFFSQSIVPALIIFRLIFEIQL